MTNITTLGGLQTFIQKSVSDIGKEFTEPDDDWMMVAFVQNKEGLQVIGLSNALFSNHRSKDMLAEVLQEAMVQYKAYRYAVLFNTHMSAEVTDEQLERIRQEEIRVSQTRGAQEMLLLVVGDAEQEDATSALIQRDGVRPPTLDEWRKVDGFEGRFAGLNERMRAIKR